MTAFSFFGLLIVVFIIVIIVTIVNERIRLKQKLRTLWDRQEPYEDFERKNASYDDYFRLRSPHYNAHLLIDDKTWSDVNMDQIFRQMNYCFSSIGEMHLYATLRNMFQVKDNKVLRAFKEDSTFRLNVSSLLSKIGKRTYPTYKQTRVINTYHKSFIFLCLLPLLSIALWFVSPMFIFVTILSMVINLALSYKYLMVISKDLGDLFFAGRVIETAHKLATLDVLKDQHDIDFSKFSKLFKYRFLLAQDSSIMGQVFAFFKQLFLIDYHIYNLLKEKLLNNEDEMFKCIEFVGDIDTAYAVSLWQETLPYYIEPTITNNQVAFEDLYHPLLSYPVANDFEFDKDALITGSNASGKSTFMKSIAINLILAQSVRTVTAEAFTYRPGIIRTAMANADDVMSGDSYFMAEIKSIKRLVDIQTKHPYYLFIDEIFKGTNTKERVAASEAVLRHIHNLPTTKLMAATHDIELTQLLDDMCDNYHFNEKIEDDEILFDYTIKEGPADTRNAIELLRITGFPKTVYNKAIQNVKT
ncbi:MutS-related protein [Staphylococcus massiliensis]|uniref:DNA mismatch repair protein MutS n=1 Tax=Staphylococcus massiliensis S46 TaxID=1229783 RepID=K9AV36_9STAP|nr:DNA mismatch repair protein MutS [Staphylococcus massiliensis]EKU46412.1 DNA mismatch repair protein MutS [Staphylococcus massiliensis S46]MCG3399876.1 DNA mismatch repair protein MutS [Staphylococcus massiliensis]MCG3402876.1 DNA mismatch repair protein MutS [Staphylococcus massiliensis]MCG3413063.1 DNA mismatch repair protein MutS [Staphylococcus massiliensis]PNZ98170.1 DNA mismatch repair protein MutS [Staphylococcus massiliensis CCUG 55927]